MKLASIHTGRGLRLHVRGRSGYVDVGDETGDARLSTLDGLLAEGQAAMDTVRTLTSRDGREVEPSQFGPAVPAPPRVLCLGLNYSEHALEGGREVPTWPETFLRTAATAIGPYADLVRPALCTHFDYEGELGIVIGSGGRYLRAEKALAAVAGYTILNDASAREWQRAGSQWTPGKNFDGTMPIGPDIVTPDDVDLSDAALTTTLNGTVMQSGRTSQMIVDIASSVEFFSSITTLRPGDVIATGTPGGVGFARTPPVWLRPGDVVEVSIEGLGHIRSQVVADPEEAPSDWRWIPGGPKSATL
jgi:2-keto-4-pentenoate hydratase/2-oxohepta-3-ene-1,7-dioic acid hydratase in catechol pathway